MREPVEAFALERTTRAPDGTGKRVNISLGECRPGLYFRWFEVKTIMLVPAVVVRCAGYIFIRGFLMLLAYTVFLLPNDVVAHGKDGG